MWRPLGRIPKVREDRKEEEKGKSIEANISDQYRILFQMQKQNKQCEVNKLV